MALILVVDDNVPSRQLYVSLLTPFGHQVIEAGDGKEGLEQARLRKPDLIISDILMPTMNGYEFVSALRKYPPLENVPVIFNSATFLDQETRALGAACGVSLFLMKPCEPEKTLAVVHEALRLEIQKPAASAPIQTGGDAISFLIDAFFEKGKQFDAVSIRLASLLELGLDLAHSCNLDEMLEKAGNAARKIIGANYSGIGILAGDGPHLRSFAFFGGNHEVAAKFVHPVFNGPIFRNIVSARKAQRAFSPFGEPAGLELPAYHPRVRGFLGVPLEVGDRVYGWVYLANKLATLEFTEEDSRILAALAAQVSLAFENAERFRTIQEHARQLETEMEERKRAEEALSRSEARVRHLVDSNIIGIAISSLDGKLIDANAAFLSLVGYTREDLLSGELRWDTMTPPEFCDSDQHAVEQLKSTGVASPWEKQFLHKDGSRVSVLSGITTLVAADGDVECISFVLDISERKQLEQQLRQAQKMDAIGQLAGGIAHDFNNLLGVIIGYSEIFEERLGQNDPLRPKAEQIKKAGQRAASLTRQLLAFSRQQVLELKVLDLNAVIADTLKMLQRLISEDIELIAVPGPELGRVKADQGQIEQIIMNLAVNARDAMPQGGKLTITTSNAELDEVYARQHPAAVPGSYAMLAVSDTGCGMDRETQARIFEPFFTTKERGKGTGLGLSTVYGVVKQSGGYIWVYSEPGRGSTFKIYLPRIEEAMTASEPGKGGKEIGRGWETVLLVEDAQPLRELAHELLEDSGYTVLEAANGADAIRVAEQHQGTIHLLLTDVVMPGMDGRKLAECMTRIYPEIKVLYASGYTDDAIVHHGVLDPGVALLQKPFTRATLTRKVREVLGVAEEHEISSPRVRVERE